MFKAMYLLLVVKMPNYFSKTELELTNAVNWCLATGGPFSHFCDDQVRLFMLTCPWKEQSFLRRPSVFLD